MDSLEAYVNQRKRELIKSCVLIVIISLGILIANRPHVITVINGGASRVSEIVVTQRHVFIPNLLSGATHTFTLPKANGDVGVEIKWKTDDGRIYQKSHLHTLFRKGPSGCLTLRINDSDVAVAPGKNCFWGIW